MGSASQSLCRHNLLTTSSWGVAWECVKPFEHSQCVRVGSSGTWWQQLVNYSNTAVCIELSLITYPLHYMCRSYSFNIEVVTNLSNAFKSNKHCNHELIYQWYFIMLLHARARVCEQYKYIFSPGINKVILIVCVNNTRLRIRVSYVKQKSKKCGKNQESYCD